MSAISMIDDRPRSDLAHFFGEAVGLEGLASVPDTRKNHALPSARGLGSSRGSKETGND
jgi:hypothetical protein